LKTEVSEKGSEGYCIHTCWYLGYAKLKPQDKWGLAVRADEYQVDTVNEAPFDGEEIPLGATIYPLLSCSRDLRIEAIERIPRLIEELEKASEQFTKTVSKAKELADEL
jgi:hypothetical protein